MLLSNLHDRRILLSHWKRTVYEVIKSNTRTIIYLKICKILGFHSTLPVQIKIAPWFLRGNQRAFTSNKRIKELSPLYHQSKGVSGCSFLRF